MIALIGILFVVAYLLGSIPFGLVLTKAITGIDLREIGSKNIGTTNVLRTGSKTLALTTLLLDMGKGSVSALLLYLFLPPEQYVMSVDGAKTPYHINPLDSFEGALLFGLIAMIGHCFPIWLKFKGGKGVATTFGALLAAVPITGLIALATWLTVAVTTRYSSLSALTACAVAPLVTFFIYGSAPALLCFVIAAFVWWRHKDNIKRLLAGEESKIGGSKKKEEAE